MVGTVGKRVEKSEVVINGGQASLSLDSLQELWWFREVLWAFLIRHVKIRYKQAVIGIGWAVVQPLLSALMFGVFLGKLARVPSEGTPYVIFALTGLVAWTYFAGAVGSAMESLVSDQGLLRKVYFPREVLPLAGVGAAIVDLLPGLAILALVAAATGIRPSIAWLALPLPLLVLVTSAAALGVTLSALNVYYRDVRYALPFVLQLGLFASPVIYSLGLIPARWRTIYAVANPVATAIDGIRRVVLHQAWPDLWLTAAALGWSLLLLVGGYVIFKRMERGFSDRI